MPGSTPLDPNDLSDEGESEYGWGPGLFPPGIANNEGQSQEQDDFGLNMIPPRSRQKAGDQSDNYARAVADRRTDSTDPDSSRDFETYGNPDRFGANPKLVRAQRRPNVSQREEPPLKRLRREP